MVESNDNKAKDEALAAAVLDFYERWDFKKWEWSKDSFKLSCQSISEIHQMTRGGVVPTGPMANRASSFVVAIGRISSLSSTEITLQSWSTST